VQKFTRPLTREIDVAGERLALTLDSKGLSVRLVGSRKAAHEMTWAQLIYLLTTEQTGAARPTAEDLSRAIETLRKGAPPKPAGETPAVSGYDRTRALLRRLEHWLAENRRHYLKGLRPGASPADLEALQTDIDTPLPEDLQALLGWHNGQCDDNLARFEQDWLLMGTGEIVAAKKVLDAGAGLTPGQGWQRAWIPFLDNDQGDYVCLDTSQAGAPVREYWQDRTDHPVVAPSLADWLEDVVNAIERGGYHEDPERGSFLRG
jgi:cell wall assembly regulator SMI1